MGFIAISTTPQTNKLLSQLAVGFPNYGFVADKLCPIVDVGEDAEQGVYFEWDKYYLNETVEDVRAIRGHSNEPDDPTVSERTYSAKAHSLAKPIDPRDFKQHKNKELKMVQSIQEGLLSLLLIKKERRVASLLTTAANYASDHKETLTGNDQWSDFVNSDIEGKIEDSREVVALSGFEPNTIEIPITTWRKIRQHPQLRALIKSLDNKLLTDDMIPASLFGLELVVPGSRSVTSLPGATEAIARIWGDFVWIGYVNKKPTPTKMDPTFAYTFQAAGRKTDTFMDRRNEVIDIQFDIAEEKITAAASGFLLTDVIA